MYCSLKFKDSDSKYALCCYFRVPTFHSRQHDWQEDHLLEESPDSVDDDRHAHIVKRDKRGRGQNLEFDAEFEKFYAEEKVDIVDQSDEQVWFA